MKVFGSVVRALVILAVTGCSSPQSSGPSDEVKEKLKANPMFADCGCYVRDGSRIAYFRSPPWGSSNISTGQKVDIVVINGDCSNLSCSIGNLVSYGDLSMTVSRTQDTDPFAKFIIYGWP
jgi:hypothetical protein